MNVLLRSLPSTYTCNVLYLHCMILVVYMELYGKYLLVIAISLYFHLVCTTIIYDAAFVVELCSLMTRFKTCGCTLQLAWNNS